MPDNDEDKAQKQKSLRESMGALRWLYAVVAGFAVTAAVERWAVDGEQGADLRFNGDLLALVVFTLFVVRFSHGTIRHFQRLYDERLAGDCRSYEPLLDFFALFLEAILFLLMAYSLRDHLQFAVLLFSVVVVDSVWIGISLLKPQTSRTPKNWLLANSFFLVAIPFFIWGREDLPLLPVLGVLAVVHTFSDYVLPDNWDFYFPGVPEAPPVAYVAGHLRGHGMWKNANQQSVKMAATITSQGQ